MAKARRQVPRSSLLFLRGLILRSPSSPIVERRDARLERASGGSSGASGRLNQRASPVPARLPRAVVRGHCLWRLLLHSTGYRMPVSNIMRTCETCPAVMWTGSDCTCRIRNPLELPASTL